MKQMKFMNQKFLMKYKIKQKAKLHKIILIKLAKQTKLIKKIVKLMKKKMKILK